LKFLYACWCLLPITVYRFSPCSWSTSSSFTFRLSRVWIVCWKRMN
jgi:hypothetical protein